MLLLGLSYKLQCSWSLAFVPTCHSIFGAGRYALHTVPKGVGVSLKLEQPHIPPIGDKNAGVCQHGSLVLAEPLSVSHTP